MVMIGLFLPLATVTGMIIVCKIFSGEHLLGPEVFTFAIFVTVMAPGLYDLWKSWRFWPEDVR